MFIFIKYDWVLILNVDMFLIIKDVLVFLLESKNNVIGLFYLVDFKGYGRVVLENYQVKKIVEEKDVNDEEKIIKSVNVGVYFFERKFLEKYLLKFND